jgi:polar amino acid transport system permease protein
VSVITVQDLMFQALKLVNVWYEPIEILTVVAGLYVAFVFLLSLAGKSLADFMRRRFGLAAA